MKSRNNAILGIRNTAPENEGMGEGTKPVSISLFGLVPVQVLNEDDEELSVTYFTAVDLGAIVGVLTIPNKSRDLHVESWGEMVGARNDNYILVITHKTSAISDCVWQSLPNQCANIYGIVPSGIIDISDVIDARTEIGME